MATYEQFPSRPHVLHSWKEIATYTGRGVRTVQRYEIQYRFPVRRPTGGPRSAVMAFSNEIDRWLSESPKRLDADLPATKIAANGSSAEMDALCQKIRLSKERAALMHARIANTHQRLENTMALCAKLNATWQHTIALRQQIGPNGSSTAKPETELANANGSRSSATAA